MSDQATTFSKISIPGICLDQYHHQRINRFSIYRCTVEKTPSDKQRASTRQRRNRRRYSRAPAPPHGLKPRTRASKLQNGRLASISDSSPADLPFGGGTASIGGCTRLHAPVRLWPPSPHASMQKHVRGTRGHAPGTRPCHVSPHCAAVSALIA